MNLFVTLCNVAADMREFSEKISLESSVKCRGNVPSRKDIVQHCVLMLMCVRLVLLNVSSGKEKKTEAEAETECDESNSSLKWEYIDLEQLGKAIIMSEDMSEESFGNLGVLLKETYSAWSFCQEIIGNLYDLDNMEIQKFYKGPVLPVVEPSLIGIESLDEETGGKDNKKRELLVPSIIDEGEEHWILKPPLLESSISSIDFPGSECDRSNFYRNYYGIETGYPTSKDYLRFAVPDSVVETDSLTQSRYVNSEGKNQFMEVSSQQDNLTVKTIPMRFSMNSIPLELDKEGPLEVHRISGDVPWEKRSLQVSKSLSLKNMLEALLLEDYGWTNLRLNMQNTEAVLGKAQWMAQVVITTSSGEEQIIARSPLCPRSRIAQSVAIFNTAKRFFPRELEYYATLRRSDAVPLYVKEVIQNEGRAAVEGVFQRGTDMLAQVMQLLNEAKPSLAPFSWSLDILDEEMKSISEKVVQKQDPFVYRAVLCSSSDTVVEEYTGARNESAVSVLSRMLRNVTRRLVGDKANQIWNEYESHIPGNIGNSRELSLYMFNSFFGFETPTSSLLTTAHSEPVKRVAALWKGTGFVCIRGKCVLISEAYATSKRDAINNTILLACRENFSHMLYHITNYNQRLLRSDLVEAAKEILERKIISSLKEAVPDTGNMS
ncbi:uncharacterized protein TM35_002041010 [Trypanosoma theileri]|uniref:Uncharacterized protein n=1 Tax=Trypanosoma theileri TaxID=67003 RepID=A0A1X0NDP0_9TRYP|nr:uncharacterized protein TM35_002041010 [Trypanosoma theileri]ORC79779.1 hypothetical protein TM35_002041010 [Trypanosoma theileri]